MRDRKHRTPGSHERRGHAQGTADDGPVRLFGIHAVAAALANPARPITHLRLTDNAEHRLADVIAKRGAKHERVHPRELDKILGADTVHQGAFLETEALPEPALEALAENAASAGPLVVLDQVTDPHNAGAILRSAAVFGASGIVMTRRNSPPLSGALAKAASGALEHVPVTLVPNLARALDELGALGLRRVGLDGEAHTPLESEPLVEPAALVFGAEGRGLRRLTRDLCDVLCRIGGDGTLTSLNVSNAAAIALHLSFMRRHHRQA